MRFLFVDRITELVPAKVIRGLKHVTVEDSFLCQSEEGKLCFIPSLIGETLGQLAAWNVMVLNDFKLRPVAGVVAKACLYRPAYIGETLLLESTIEQVDETAVQYNSIAHINGEKVFTIEGALGPMLPMNEFISVEEVRQQFAEIYRPGIWLEAQQGIALNEKYPPSLPLMNFDRILDCEPNKSLKAEKMITRAAPYFPDHFPKKPVLPLTVLLECKLNLAKEFVKRSQYKMRYQISEIRKIKMSGFVYPGDKLVCDVNVKSQDTEQLVLSFRSEVEAKRVCVLEVVMTAKG